MNYEEPNTEATGEDFQDDFKTPVKFKALLVIVPGNRFKVLWNFIGVIFILYQAIVIPFVIALDLVKNPTLVLLEIIQDCFFVVDLIINFNTAYVQEGELVVDRKKIALKYLKGWFTLDLISSIPYGIVVSTKDYFNINSNKLYSLEILGLLRILKISRMFGLTKLLRIAKLNMMVRFFNDNFDSKLVSLLNEFLKVIFLLLIISHWMACIWYYIGKSTHDSSWIDDCEIRDAQIKDKYVASLYFVLISMMTVGFGDISPMNTKERVFAVFLQLASGIFFAYMLGTTASLVQTISISNEEDEIKYHSMIQLVNRKGINRDLSNRITEYLKLRIKDRELKKFDPELFNMLDSKLKEEVKVILNIKFVVEMNFLKSRVNFVKILVNEIIEESFYPSETIYNENELSKKVFFLNTGSVINYIQDIDLVISIHKDTTIFGHIEFFGGFDRLTSMESKNVSRVSSFSITSFKKCLIIFRKYYPDDYLELKDFLISLRTSLKKSNLEELGTYCEICGQNDHFTNSCLYLLDEDIVVLMRNKNRARTVQENLLNINGYMEKQRNIVFEYKKHYNLFTEENIIRNELKQ